MPGRPVVTLYGREGCHLCDEALALLQPLSRTLHFTIESVDIEGDEELLRRYVFEIPVITVGEVEVARAPVSPALLEDALRAQLR